MADIITLSSDEDEGQPTAKQSKLVLDEVKKKTFNGVEEASAGASGSESNIILENSCKEFVIASVVSVRDDTDEANKVINNPTSHEKDETSKTIDHNPTVSSSDTASTSLSVKSIEDCTTLEGFLTVCSTSVRDSKYDERLQRHYPKLKDLHEKCKLIDRNDRFKELLVYNCEFAKKSAAHAVNAFKHIYCFLSDSISDTYEVAEEDVPVLRRMETIMNFLSKRIQKFNNMDITMNNEEDDNHSPYQTVDRYSRKLVKIYEKYCRILKRNPNVGRPTYEKIKFTSSNYNAINVAITKTFNRKKNRFPTYSQMEKCIRSIPGLGLSEQDIVHESRHCFVKLGEILQLKRRLELNDHLMDTVSWNNDVDPATSDADLDRKLLEYDQDAKGKMEEIMERYSKLQTDQPEHNEEFDNYDSSSSESDEDDDAMEENSS